MEEDYKVIPFDINRLNEEGIKLQTRDGQSARVVCTDVKNVGDYPIGALIYVEGPDASYEGYISYRIDGRYCNEMESSRDLVMLVPRRSHKMTYRELSWWLRDCPEEHREYAYLKPDGHVGVVQHELTYSVEEANEVPDSYVVRQNGGPWKEPIIDD